MKDTIVAPLFPLPDLVFFPGNWLPLHVFEPRYLDMTRDALEGSKVIGMVQLRPKWEENYEGTPAIYEVATLGKIVQADRLEDGRFNILLYGVKRVQIVKELPKEDIRYRLAQVGFVESNLEGEGGRLSDASHRLLALCHKIVELRPVHKRWLDNALSFFPKIDSFSDLAAGFLSHHFKIGSYERQSILEETSVARRLELINVQAGRVVASIIAEEEGSAVEHGEAEGRDPDEGDES